MPARSDSLDMVELVMALEDAGAAVAPHLDRLQPFLVFPAIVMCSFDSVAERGLLVACNGSRALAFSEARGWIIGMLVAKHDLAQCKTYTACGMAVADLLGGESRGA
jgi:hypothetical protein